MKNDPSLMEPDRGGVGCLSGADTGSYSRSSAERAAVNEPQVSKQGTVSARWRWNFKHHARRIGMSTSEERARNRD
jgi:hypothetical protein